MRGSFFRTPLVFPPHLPSAITYPQIIGTIDGKVKCLLQTLEVSAITYPQNRFISWVCLTLDWIGNLLIHRSSGVCHVLFKLIVLLKLPLLVCCCPFFYYKTCNTTSCGWSVASINTNGIHNIPRWNAYPAEAKAEYLRLVALAEARDKWRWRSFVCR